MIFKIRVKNELDPNINWLIINDGHINFDNGIRFVYQLTDENFNNIEKKLFVISGDDFDNLGKSEDGIRIEILKHVLQHCESEIVT